MHLAAGRPDFQSSPVPVATGGVLRTGDDVVIQPSGLLTRISKIESAGEEIDSVYAPMSVTVDGGACTVRDLLARARARGWTVWAGAYGQGSKALPATLVVGRGLAVWPARPLPCAFGSA